MYELIDLKVGSSCNNKCVHCCAANDTRDKNLSLSKIHVTTNVFIAVQQMIQEIRIFLYQKLKIESMSLLIYINLLT